MRLSDIGELKLVEGVRRRFSPGLPASVIKGIGDDAAVLRPCGKGEKLLLSSDIMAEGVHFTTRLVTPFQLGFKLVSVNASDIYAMGGAPRHMLLDIAAPGGLSGRFLDRLLDGVEEAAGRYGVSVVGGDFSACKSGLVVSATVAGCARRPVGRGGARPGQGLYVTGTLGESAMGLRLLEKIGRAVEIEKGEVRKRPLGWETMEPLLRRHLMPVPSRPYGKARAMIDISDGLYIDLARLCAESGVGARVYAGRIPVSGAVREAARYFGTSALVAAATGGEDYQMLFTAPRGSKPRKGVMIGTITVGDKIIAVHEDGREGEIKADGFRHFSKPR